MAPPLLDAVAEDEPPAAVAGDASETSFLEPTAPVDAREPFAEPETSYLEPDPPTFREAVPAVESAPEEHPPVEERSAAFEPAPSIAAAVGAAPAVPMSATQAQPDAGLHAGRQPSQLERRLAQLAPEPAAAAGAEPVIGAPDVRLFDCPACGRPLQRGTARCTNCGTRLVGGRPMRRVATFAGVAVVAVLVLGAVGMTALAMSPSQPQTGGVPTGSAGASQPTATAAAPSEPPTTPTGVPAAAAAALGGTAVVNNRITTDAAALAQVLSNAGTPTINVARALRALAADAQLGLDMTGRLTPWTDAAPVAAKLDAFYGGLADAARDALRVSLNDGAAYRRAGAELIAQVRGLAEVDAATRQLAATAGLSLPPLQAAGAGVMPSP
jgi:hypothetical protein